MERWLVLCLFALLTSQGLALRLQHPHDKHDKFSQLANSSETSVEKKVLQASVAVCLLAKTMMWNFERLVKPMVKTIVQMFKNYTVIVVESNSIDGTRENLTNWAKHGDISPIHLILLPRQNMTMAAYRNHYLDFVLDATPAYDYMIVFDSDLVDISIPGLRDTLFNEHMLWGGMTANGKRNVDLAYYDIAAFRSQQFQWSPHAVNNPQITPDLVNRFTQRITEDWPPMRIQSGFGGLGVYKVKYLKGCRYTNFDLQGKVCEHVPFNDCITRKNGAPVYMNPKMVTKWHWACSDCCGDVPCEDCTCAPLFTNSSNMTLYSSMSPRTSGMSVLVLVLVLAAVTGCRR